MFDAHRDDLGFGHWLLADEVRLAGQPMADRTAWRLCSRNGWHTSMKQSAVVFRPDDVTREPRSGRIDDMGSIDINGPLVRLTGGAHAP